MYSEKTSVCTGTHDESETSLNTVVYENVKVYMNQYVKLFLKFPQIFFKNALSLYFYKLYKFIKIYKINLLK